MREQGPPQARHRAGDLGPDAERDLGYGGPSLIGAAGSSERPRPAPELAPADPDTREIMLDAPPPTRRSRAEAAPRRGPAWLPRVVTLADQGMSSVSNILAVVLVARVLSKGDFGLFSLGYTVLTLTLSLSRAYFGTMVSLAPDVRAARAMTRRLHSTLLLLALPATLLVFGISAAATGGDGWQMLLIVAIATPVVCLQDIIRFGASSSGRQWTALVSDGVWVALMGIPFVLRWRMSSTAALWLWLGAAVAAWVVAQVMFPQPIRLREGWAQVRVRHPISESVAASALVATVGSMWILFVTKFAINPAATGSLRGAAVAMGPLNVLTAFISLGLTPALVRRPRTGDLRFCGLVSMAMAGATCAWGLLLLALPGSVGKALFADSWAGIRHVLPFTTLEYLCLGTATGALLGLKVRHRARELMSQRLATGGITILLGSAVAFATQNVRLVSTTLALAALASASIGWFQLMRSPATNAPAQAPQVRPARGATEVGAGSPRSGDPGGRRESAGLDWLRDAPSDGSDGVSRQSGAQAAAWTRPRGGQERSEMS